MSAADFNVSVLRASAGVISSPFYFRLAGRPPLNATFPSDVTPAPGLRVGFRFPNAGRTRGGLTSASALMLPQNPVAGDICATVLTGGAALSLLRFWGDIAKRGFVVQVSFFLMIIFFNIYMGAPVRSLRGSTRILPVHVAAFLQGRFYSPSKTIFPQAVCRKLVHISVGLVFMLFWPLFSPGRQGAVLAALVPGVNIIKMVLIGLGIWKDEATVKSMSRHGDHRELLKGPLYYASAITLACAIYWRTSPIAIAMVCNLCAGDGFADLVGRRFGIQKIPYNRNKSFFGSLAMAIAGFLASIGYMHYFASFGFIEESWEMVFGFLIVSLGSTLVESLPISSVLDDNLTIPVTSLSLGFLFFQS